MVKKILLGLLVLFITVSTCEAAQTEIKGVRYSYGSGTVRIVIDMTRKVNFAEFYLENPSRLVLDLEDAVLDNSVQNEFALDSTAAKIIRIAQFNSSTVRMVVETMAEVKIFHLDGGTHGHRLVIDVGNATFKENPDLNKPTVEKPDKPAIEKPEKKKDKDKDKEKKKKKKKIKKPKTEKDKDKNRDEDKDKDKDKVKRPVNDDEKDLFNITGLKGKTIAIDPGHGGNDAGAIGPSGVTEKSVTLRVALELADLLEAEGAKVVMTRKTDRTVSSKGAAASAVEELQARCDIANRSGADIFISIHADSFTNPSARGTTGYYYESGGQKSQRLADCVRRALCEQIRTPSRGTQPCNFYVVKHTDMPATLVELAFISNKEEEELMSSREGVSKMAHGILDGIEDYFG